jgi:hypothetical protein
MDEKLKTFKVCSNGDLDLFWSKLIAKNGWSLSYAEEVFSEYKKFIWLAKNTQSRVVPSKAIDRVWHLHMTFTKSYWHDLCKDTLHFEFHHIPSAKNSKSEELDKIDYKNTLKMYEVEFGEFPSAKYWPSCSKKRKFNSFKHIVLPFFLVTFLTACSLSSKEDFMTTLKWGIGIYVVYKLLKWLSSNSGSGGGCSSGCGSSCGGD